MHVFCPDCNAEYKVDERSSLTKTIKFVCIECESSWIDKFEKREQAKREVYASQELASDVVIENKNKEVIEVVLKRGQSINSVEAIEKLFRQRKLKVGEKIKS